MWIWLGMGCAWLAGLVVQLSGAGLVSLAAAQAGVLAALLGIGLAWWLRGRNGFHRAWVLCAGLAVALLGWATTGWRTHDRLAHQLSWHAMDTLDVALQVRVVGLPQPRDDGVRFDAEPLQWQVAEGQLTPPARIPRRIRLSAASAAGMDAVRAGQVWRLTARLHAPDGVSNPGGLDPTLHPFLEDVGAIGRVVHRVQQPVHEAESDRVGWGERIERWRQQVRERLFAAVPDTRVAGVLAGLAVGDQSAITPEDWDVFRRTGVAHLVSISGAHVVLLGWWFGRLVRPLWSRSFRLSHWLPAPTVQRISMLLGSAVYAMVAGWGIPAQRTVWTLALMIGLHALGRRWPKPLIWLTAAVCVSAWQPWALVQASFWLSFVAVAMLMALDDDLESWLSGSARQREAMGQNHPPQRLAMLAASLWAAARGLWRVQWRLSLALTPLSLVVFQQASVVGLLANLVAIPVFTAVLTPLALIGMAWPVAWSAAAWVVQGMQALLAPMAAWPAAMWSAPLVPLGLAGLALAVAWLWVRPMPWSWRLATVPALLPLLWLPSAWLPQPPPRHGEFAVAVLDVGQGSAVLVRTAQHALLFDAGGKLFGGADMGERAVVPALRALGVRTLDALVLSHDDLDHTGGAPAVLGEFGVRTLWHSLPVTHDLLTRPDAQRRLPLTRTCKAGAQWHWDGVRMTMLHPAEGGASAAGATTPDNARSCVLRIEAVSGQGRSIVLTGDIEAAQERAVLSRHAETELRSTVMLVPHHGSQTSSSEAWLAAVDPDLVVVQSGLRSPYRHPAEAVMARYAAQGVPVVRTTHCGTWLWHSDMAPDRGQCWQGLRHRPWRQPVSEVGSDDRLVSR